MKLFKLVFLSFIWILSTSFKPLDHEVKLITNKSDIFASDKQQLETLIRKAYQWILETKNQQVDFDPIENKKGDKYVGLNLNTHKKRLEELKKANFFSQQFLDNYNKIGLKLDSNLKNKKIEWLVGDMPPFGNDANPWCDCQDNPDEYWKTMTITNLKVENNKAVFYWTWSWKGNFKYKVTTIKENGIWKISYLQGFDYDAFTKIY
jgi:hypothetical protein